MTFGLCDEQEPVDSNRRINFGCKVFTTSVLLQASCTAMSDVTLKVGDLLTQNCTSVTVEKNWV
jgi:hypothetical protein